MNTNIFSVFLIILVFSQSDINHHSYNEDYVKANLVSNSPGRSLFLTYTKESENELKTRMQSHFINLLENGNTSSAICSEFDLFFVNQKFLNNFLTYTDTYSRKIYKFYTGFCFSNNIVSVKNFKHVQNYQFKLKTKYSCDYHEFNFENFSLTRSSTLTYSYIFLYSDFQKHEYHEKNSIVSHSNLLFMAKHISKQRYQSINHTAIKPRPRSSAVILLMLMMCGDTGSLLNPGPIRRNVVDKCGVCVNSIKTNSRILSCSECNIKVHKKCEQANISHSYICNLCLYKLLPFNNIFDEFLDDNTNYVGLNNANPMVDNTSNYNAKQFECFKNKGLHFLHANARSIFHKLPELKLIAKQSNAAVIAISETWLDDSYTDACVQIEGYNIIRRDRASHAGGVCAYIREDLSYNIRSDLNNPDLEDLWFEILLKKSKPLYIGVCYRTNNNTKCFECLESTLSKLRSDCDFVVLGDFNVCLIKSKGKLGSIYRQLLNFFSSKQLINEPTRITETSSSLLDHIFTNNSEKIYQSGVLNVGLSDHLIVFCSRKIIRGQIGKHKTIKIRSVKNYSPIEFLNKLRNVDWTIVTNCTDVNKAWDNFKTIFFKL